ncbi:unnamed protein product [Acanthocheilonema viteae]|uniref:Major facilitator superfamily (MFS) profile domain-containing protein n=1 Tax=Acanthocheilonema viteae TaxID=6277 RepID=A0A498SA65_ACAVI|nr:unnamed protein product [Acanthocheilonema viteae]
MCSKAVKLRFRQKMTVSTVSNEKVDSPSTATINLDEGKTPWGSLDSSANLEFFGWAIASYSIGSTISNFFFGLWNQKTMSTKYPASFGNFLMALGNLLYGFLPTIGAKKWSMLLARFIVGLGSGNLCVLRTYAATASIPHDRTKALSITIVSFVLGLSIGPALQAWFTPLGRSGFQINIVVINMYTLPAFLMVVISLISIVLLCTIFTEKYSGILRSDKSGIDYFSVNIKEMAPPFTIAMYNWTDYQAVLYNGIIQSICCVLNVMCYFIIGFTPLQHCNKRAMIVIGLTCFAAYHVINLPWPFYTEYLDFIKQQKNDVKTRVEL